MLKTLVKRALRKDSSGDEQGTSRHAAISVKNKSSKKNKQSRVLDTAVFHAITKAVVERRKVSSTELCQAFEMLDEHEVGLLTEASFAKGLVKIGIKLKPDQVESLADCFRREVKQKKNAPDIDYYAFVDFAIQERDTDVLVAVGDKLRRAIASFDKKADDRQPWNAMDELRRLDKKERGRISPDAFRTFLESNRSIEFELSMKQVSAVTERFEFEDDKGTSGVDYEQFATWLQPSLHVDVAQLHVHIKHLFAKAQAECNLSLKTIFEEIDDDDSGHVTASELKEALSNLGLPITDTQIKCLVDEYDVNGDGRVDYSEFTSAFAAKRSTTGNVNDSDDNDDDGSRNHDMNKKKKQTKQGDGARRPLIPVATQTAIEKAVVRKDGHRLSGKVLCAVFEQSDTHELGHLDDATFAKCVGKLGLKLKSAQMKQVVECFRMRSNQKSKTNDVVDYYGFVDYAINIPDTDKLTAIGDKMRRAISRHDKNAKHDNEPFNLGGALRKLDKKERQWLSSDVVRGYLESSHGSVDFELTSKEVALLVGRFEFEFDSAKASNLAVDYEQLATWVQPALNVNVKQLHTRVSMLLQKAKNEHQLSLKNVFDAIDDDRSGSINRSEFKQALHVMGLPLTEAQAYCLVDEYDTSGDGRIQYSEFASAFGSKATSSSKDESEDDNTKKDAPKTKATRLVPAAAEEAIATAVRGKRKLSPADLCHAFEKYDKGDHGGGLIDEATFTKVVGKSLGIKLKSEHLKVLVECFRKGKSFKSSKSKTTADIDYVGFVDFATNIPDTAKVAAIGDKMRRAIKQYDATSTDRQPFNVLEDLQSLDKRDTGRLKPNVFREYVESNPRIEFGLTEQEATRLTERFEFEYADKSAGVDYDQVAKWLQPSLHYNTNDLHKHVSKLFAKAKKDGHMLSLKAIFEDIDDDGSGHVTRMELGDALSGMGLPLTSGQIKCLVDEYDLNGDGKIQYDEFAKAFSKPVDGSGDSSSDEATRRKQKNHPVKSPRPSKSKPKTARTTLLTSATLDAIAHAVRGKRKISATELCAVFEKYDTDESGLLDPPEFTKCVAKKLGIKLQKDQLNAVIDCFRKDGRVDYYGFVDFAVSMPDSDKLCAAGDKMRLAIGTYNNQNSDSKQPFNMMHELRKLDKNDRWRLKPRVFRGYLKSNKTVTFNLTEKEVELVASHFEFEYANDDDVGVDYEHFAKWVQPQLHVNVADLHMHVKALFHKAKKQCNLSLKQIFEDIDDDDSGYITRNEFQTALRGLSLPLTDTQIRCLVDEYDMNGDDRIEYAEFAQAFAVAPDTDESDAKSETSGAETESFRNRIVRRWGKVKKLAGRQRRKNEGADDDEDKDESDRKTAKKTLATIKRLFSPKSAKPSKKQSHVSSESDSDPPTTKSSNKSKTGAVESSDSDKPKTPTTTKTPKKKQHSKPVETTNHSSDDDDDYSDSRKKKHKTSRSSPIKAARGGHAQKAKKGGHIATSDDDEAVSPSKTSPRKSTKQKAALAADETSDTHSSPRKKAKKTKHKKQPQRQSDGSDDSSPVRTSSPSKRNHTSRPHERSSSTSSVQSSSPRKAFQRGKPSRKKKPRAPVQSSDDGDDAPSSGMSVSDLRKFKDRARSKSKHKSHKHRRDSSTDSNASDAEYFEHMKAALRTAFDFFDVDYSNSIDKDELGHILRAVGDDVTVDELHEIMRQVDMDASGQIDFDEFYLMMKTRLHTKQWAFNAQTEMDVSAIFDHMDTDHNGALDIAEFQHALLQQMKVPLTQDEFYALLDEVDTNNDGTIDLHEFTSFMKVVQDVSTAGYHNDATRGIPRAALSAMKKVVRRAPVDPESSLLMLLGVPTNFRPSVTSTAVRMRKHTMEYVLSFPPPEVIYNMAQAGNLVTVPAQPPQEAWLGIEKSEAQHCQAIVSLKQAKGVPTPYDKRQQDVVGRKVRVCFFDVGDMSGTVAASSARPMSGNIVGNIHEIPVAWHKGEEDVWNFSKSSTKADDYKFIMRTNAPKDDLYLFIEFIVDLVSESASEMKRKERKQTKEEMPPPLSDTSIEMTCCWAKVPLVNLLSTTVDIIRLEEPLFGGTILNPVELDEDEISRRRYGWRAIAKALKPYTPPMLSIKSLQIPKLSVQEKLQIAQLPSTVVAPYSAVPMLQEYMLLMMSVLSNLQSPSSVHTCEPALKLFPKILDDHIVYEAFRLVFDNEMRGPFKTPNDRTQRFCDLVLRMWPAFIVPKPRIADEETKECESKDDRAKHMHSMAKGKYGLRDVKETSVPFHVREVSFQRLI